MEETKPGLAKTVFMAFIIGGMFGLLCEALVMVYSFTPLYAAGFSTVSVLATLGVVGAVLFYTGIYPKLEALGGMGAMLPFCGLCAAVADCVVGVGSKTGSKGKAVKAALVELGLKIVVPGVVISCIVAAAYFLSGFSGSVFYTTYAPGGLIVEQVGPPWNMMGQGSPAGVPVGINAVCLLWAFMIPGFFCAFCQVIWALTKIPIPIFFILLIVCSAILTPFGFIKPIVQLSGGGFQMLIAGAGEAVAGTFYALVSGVPGPIPFISVISLFSFLFILGILTGLAKLSALQKADALSVSQPKRAS